MYIITFAINNLYRVLIGKFSIGCIVKITPKWIYFRNTPYVICDSFASNSSIVVDKLLLTSSYCCVILRISVQRRIFEPL